MKVEKILNRWINIKPVYLTNEIEKNIKKELFKKYKNYCDGELGYILKINNIEKIKDNFLSNSNSDIMVLVEFGIECFKPNIDDILKDVEVCGIYEDGILVEAYNILKILIPKNSYDKQYTYSNNELKNKTSFLKKGSKLDIKINAIKYKDHKFNCIGDIV